MDTCGDRCAELSGLAWNGDTLILLPQYPKRFSPEADGCLFGIGKDRICSFLDGRSSSPISPQPIPLIAPGVRDGTEHFQGYEAIAIVGSRVYLTIEAGARDSNSPEPARGYLIAGRIESDPAAVHLDLETLTPIPPQAGLPNMSYETLVPMAGGILAIHEVNGANVNASPTGYLFDLELRGHSALRFPAIEYRITDATYSDSEGRFWVINYFWPGDERILKPARDDLIDGRNVGSAHARGTVVERLVELRCDKSEIVRTKAEPIELKLLDGQQARNWEGVVRLDDRGFLIVTDRHPSTMVGFVSIE